MSYTCRILSVDEGEGRSGVDGARQPRLEMDFAISFPMVLGSGSDATSLHVPERFRSWGVDSGD